MDSKNLAYPGDGPVRPQMEVLRTSSLVLTGPKLLRELSGRLLCLRAGKGDFRTQYVTFSESQREGERKLEGEWGTLPASQAALPGPPEGAWHP